MRKFLAFAGLCAVSFFLAPGAYAQTGKISGKVTDAQGGVLPGATVVAKDLDKGIDTTATTNASGIYVFSTLPRGNYRVTITLSGFNNFVREGLILNTGLSITVDAALQVAGVTETVTVSGESPMISTAESKVGGVVENIYIENAPINTRDVQQLALLVPGAKQANQFDPTKSRVPAITFGTNALGRGVLFTLDGGDNSDDTVGGIVQQVSMDSVQEFEVVTSRIKAEYGRAGGGAITVVTKSGTNSFKGSAFEFFRDETLNAKTQPEKDAGIEKPPFQRHQFGAFFGGPIVQDKSFFFVTYERLVEDFNSILTLAPETLSLYPSSLIEDHGGLGVITQPFRRNYFTTKFTQQFNPQNRLDVRYAYENNTRDGDQVGSGFNANATQDNAGLQTNHLWSILGRFQTLAGQSGVNTFVFQASDWLNDIISNTQTDFHTPGTPQLIFPSLTLGQNGNTPQETHQRKYQFRDDFSYAVGAHDMKFGGEAVRAELGLDLPFLSQGTFRYANDGDPTDQSIQFTQFDIIPPFARPNTDYGFYAQDDWRVGENLTLNLGVRYDVEIGTLSGIRYEGANAQVLLNDPRSPYVGQGKPRDDKNNVAPRLGFAWDVGGDGNTVVRGGWGFFYDKVVLNASLFTDIDSYNVAGVVIVGANYPGGVVPFGPDNLPAFQDLFPIAGFRTPFDPVIVPGNNFQFARTSQATIGVSHQFTPTLALDVDYIRSDTRLRGKSSDLNEQRVPFDPTSRLFYPEFQSQLKVVESVGKDTYNGLQLSLRKRMANKATFVVNYTLSKLEGDADNGWENEAECRTCIGNDRDYGPLPSDTRNRVVLSGVFQLPADFQFSALFQGESSRPVVGPLAFDQGAQSSQDLNGNGRITDFTEGPNGEPPGRGNFHGDPTYILDVRLVKFFRFGDAKDLQVMFEGFNLMNHLNRGPNFYRIQESANFGDWTGQLWSNQFQAQLGLRFSF